VCGIELGLLVDAEVLQDRPQDLTEALARLL
jgi:hypothetical protein